MLITGLSMLTFLSPWWALGAVAAIGLPLLAHLLSRSRYREVVFPATRFVAKAVEQTTRIERPRHLLLMLLRWLLLLLVVLAFMRPRWLPQAEASDSEGGVALIILLDASASMQRVESGSTLYERAVREAEGILDELDPSRDVATVVRVSRTSDAVLPEPTANRKLLGEQLKQSGPTYEPANWPGAVAAVQKLAQSSDRPVRVVVLSDQQGDGPVFEGDAAMLRLPVRMIRLDVPGGNVAVRLVDVTPYPPTMGQPVRVVAQVASDGQTTRAVAVRLSLDGAQASRPVQVGPGSRQLVEWSLPAASREGLILLRVHIDDDDPIELDNATGLPLRIVRQSQALVVHGPTAQSLQLADRVAAMLRPGEATGLVLPRVDTAIDVQALAKLQAADPAQLRTVVLLEPERIDSGLAEALKAYMQRGGGVVALISDSRLNAAQSLLPWPLVIASSGRDTVLDQPARQIDFSLPPLQLFEGPARAGLASLVFPGTDPADAAPGSERILTADNGRVIVAATTLGRGRLIALNTDLSSGPGGLLAEPAFVVLFNELCRYASPGPSIPTPVHPGDPLPANLRNAGNLSVPDGVDPTNTTITRPGAYFALDSSGSIRDGLWAELDPAESDTRTGQGWIDRDGNSAGSAVSTAASSSVSDSILGRAQAIELWPYLAIGALLLAAVESLALWRFASAKGGGA